MSHVVITSLGLVVCRSEKSKLYHWFYVRFIIEPVVEETSCVLGSRTIIRAKMAISTIKEEMAFLTCKLYESEWLFQCIFLAILSARAVKQSELL